MVSGPDHKSFDNFLALQKSGKVFSVAVLLKMLKLISVITNRWYPSSHGM